MNANPTADEHSACDVCHRTMLKGESAEPYLTPSRERRHVCQLCAPRAQHEGWIREAAAPHEPARPQRPPERRRLFKRTRRRGVAEPPTAGSEAAVGAEPEEGRAEREAPPNGEGLDAPGGTPVLTRLRQAAAGPRSPRQVRAVPTNAQLKIERALDLFNSSEHPRTVAGIARTLGAPRASALTSRSSAAEVVLTVAWELSWYEFAVDLSDAREPVRLRSQGQELSELPKEAQEWNLEATAEGMLAPLTATGEEAPEESGGESPESVGEDSASSYSH
jgi:hypothetical protein